MPSRRRLHAVEVVCVLWPSVAVRALAFSRNLPLCLCGAARGAPAALQVVERAAALAQLVDVAVLRLSASKHAGAPQQELQHRLPAARARRVSAQRVCTTATIELLLEAASQSQ